MGGCGVDATWFGCLRRHRMSCSGTCSKLTGSWRASARPFSPTLQRDIHAPAISGATLYHNLNNRKKEPTKQLWTGGCSGGYEKDRNLELRWKVYEQTRLEHMRPRCEDDCRGQGIAMIKLGVTSSEHKMRYSEILDEHDMVGRWWRNESEGIDRLGM